MQINFTKFGDNKVKNICLAHLLDLVAKLEIVENAAYIGREAIDVADQVLVYMVWITLQLFEREW